MKKSTWKLVRGEEFLPVVSLAQLQRLYDQENRAKPKLRLLAALHRKRGLSMDAIAQQLHKPRRTVHFWLRAFQQRGVAAKDALRQSGRPPKLSLAQRQDLLRRLEAGPPRQPQGLWTTRAVREWVAQRYGVRFVPMHIGRLLRALGFARQRPRPRHPQAASRAEVARFKKKPVGSLGSIGGGDLWWARRMKRPSD